MIAPPEGPAVSPVESMAASMEGQPTDWDGILDQLERSLVEGCEFTPPESPAVLPAHLLARAEQLLERQRAAVRDLEIERDRVASELDSHRRSAARQPSAQPASGPPLEL